MKPKRIKAALRKRSEDQGKVIVPYPGRSAMCLGDETEEIERSSDRIAEVSTSSQHLHLNASAGESLGRGLVDGVTTIQGEQGNLFTGRRAERQTSLGGTFEGRA